jgi:hypothetical protein
MSLQTPTVIRILQRKLYRKAKESKPPRRGRLRPGLFSVCLTVKPVGEPDAGDRHVRFDERGWETERCRMAQATAPILDSTFCDIARSRMDFRFRGKSGRAANITGMTEFGPEGDIGLIEIPRRNSTRHLDITKLIPRRRVDRR